ncbi:hypothetical protein AX14_002713 [Amanita brunnescens Koide BX004]|nr:hypothetical protein AX14_002713 [Amanita brunnescens Koide BX004]
MLHQEFERLSKECIRHRCRVGKCRNDTARSSWSLLGRSLISHGLRQGHPDSHSYVTSKAVAFRFTRMTFNEAQRAPAHPQSLYPWSGLKRGPSFASNTTIALEKRPPTTTPLLSLPLPRVSVLVYDLQLRR